MIPWPKPEYEPHSETWCKGGEECECMCTECMNVWSCCVCPDCTNEDCLR